MLRGKIEAKEAQDKESQGGETKVLDQPGETSS
jgi:hypothetical protein